MAQAQPPLRAGPSGPLVAVDSEVPTLEEVLLAGNNAGDQEMIINEPTVSVNPATKGYVDDGFPAWVRTCAGGPNPSDMMPFGAPTSINPFGFVADGGTMSVSVPPDEEGDYVFEVNFRFTAAPPVGNEAFLFQVLLNGNVQAQYQFQVQQGIDQSGSISAVQKILLHLTPDDVLQVEYDTGPGAIGIEAGSFFSLQMVRRGS